MVAKLTPPIYRSCTPAAAVPGDDVDPGHGRKCNLGVDLLELVGDFLDASLGARLVAGLIVAADADAADGVVADIDRIAAAKRNHLGQLPLTRVLLAGVGAVAPFQRRAAEGAGGVGL